MRKDILTGSVICILAFVSLCIGIFSSLGVLASFRIVFGSAFVLFLPGFVLSYLFFPNRQRGIDLLERIALSFALSIAVVPLVVFYLNLLGVPISLLSSFLTVLGIIVLGLVGIYFRKTKRG